MLDFDMRIHVGIPARMGASRFPGKPLAKIAGKSMLEHVYKRSSLATNVSSIFIATCDDEIAASARSYGAQVVMTDPGIMRPGLRVAAAAKSMQISDEDILVIVQGDEPLVHPEMIETAVSELLANYDFNLGTLVGLANEEEFNDKNEVKVVFNDENRILYMSRSPIPFEMTTEKTSRFKQVAVMPFRARYLQEFQTIIPRKNELIEAIELIRALENGDKVLAIKTSRKNVSVDTPEGLIEAEHAMLIDELYGSY
jgi:3-deoxy-manno-octulosonate cytidylyltransferase (CMP-KDO synthetase)